MANEAAGAQVQPDASGAVKAGEAPKPGETKTGGQGTAEEQAAAAAAAAAEPKGKDGEVKPQPKAPEKYAFTVQDDRKASVPQKLLERVESIARANDWTNDEANAELTDMLKFDDELRQGQIATFETETKGDADFGGDHLTETQRLANLAIDKVFPEGHRLRERFMGNLKRTGFGSELSIVAFLATVGKLAAEDTPVRGRQAPRVSGSTADGFYDHPSSKKVQEEAAKAG
jgi:hypothetical protein